ncbi:MAG: alpha/beta fold hydrolase [Acidobacteriota bacterium]|nr:alpha/beta fold hydrolase [Acidobacteriota bacterium]
MAIAQDSSYRFGRFKADAAERVLFRDGEPVILTAKAFDTLLALLERHGHVASKCELMDRVWPETHVDENNLAQNISILRKALGSSADGRGFIETVPRRGYRFIGDVLVAGDLPAEAAAVVRSSQHTPFAPPKVRYARSGDVNIAYEVLGDGPRDLVFVMGWISHLDYFWTEPSFARFLRRLASFSRLILFDKRGTGLSDRVADLPTLEQRMDDVRAVLDAVGSKRAALCGVSEGGPMCALYAATYPEKTDALIMIGTYARRVWAPDYPWAPTPEQREQFLGTIAKDWGGPVGIAERAPSRANDPEFRDWWATYLRMGASPGAAETLTRMNSEVDVRHVLPTIRVPTQVIHRTGDLCLRVEEGRYVAQSIPGAQWVELPGVDHLPFVGDQDAIVDAIQGFLTGSHRVAESADVLATVVAIALDAAIETDQASLERHHAHALREIALFRGRAFATDGNLMLATFDGPARAIRCATAIRDFAQQLPVALRIGIHTGECRLIDPQPTGASVEVARSISRIAKQGEVLASRTVRDLVAGSGLVFREAGAHSLPDVAGESLLFVVA